MAKSKGNAHRKEIRCPECGGEGWHYRANPMRICGKCNGAKRLPNPSYKPKG